jgi:ABC-2 type transport system permease protein
VRSGAYLAARREVREWLRSRAFRASTALQVVFVAVVVLISVLSADEGPTDIELGVSGTSARPIGEAAQSLDRSFDADLELRPLADRSAATRAVEDETVDGAVVDATLLLADDPPDELEPLVQTAARRVQTEQLLRERGLSEQQVAGAIDPPGLEVRDAGGSGSEGAGLAFAGALLLYIALLTSGYAIAGGVVEEKQTRIIEVVLTAIRPLQLLMAKVAGIGLVLLCQLALVAAVGLGTALASGQVDLPGSTPETLLAVALFFVLGYALYAFAFAAGGAVVSRQEDIQSTTTPLLAVLIAGFLATTAVVDNPDTSLAQVLTLLPPTAPLVVPARVAQDALPAWELAASAALTAAAVVVLALAAARIYERAVLEFGEPLKLSEALRLLR